MSAAKKTTTSTAPSLYLLPISGITNPTLSVREAREALKATLLILSGILGTAVGYPAFLRQALLDIRFHIVSGLSFIDSYLGAGYYHTDSINDVEGLPEALYNHLIAIQRAKPLWNAWATEVKTIHKQPGAPEFTAPTSPRPQSALGAVDATASTAVAPTAPTPFEEVSKPTPLKTYMGMAVVGAAGLLLWRLLR